MPVPHLVKMNNLFGQYLQDGCFQIPFCPISMSADHRDRIKIRFFFQLNNKTLLHSWLYWNMRWTHKVLFFKVFRDVKLVTLIHGHSYLILLEIVVGSWKLRNFQESQAILNGLQKKLDVVYPSGNLWDGISGINLWNYSEDLGPCWKYWEQPIFPKFTGEKVSLWPG